MEFAGQNANWQITKSVARTAISKSSALRTTSYALK
jgi:hypothetical protein